MGWLRMLLLGDIGQQMDIEEMRQSVARTRSASQAVVGASVKSLASRVASLEAECDSLKLFVAALVRVLKDKQLATQDELLGIVESIDREDGRVDGKFKDALPRRVRRDSTSK